MATMSGLKTSIQATGMDGWSVVPRLLLTVLLLAVMLKIAV